MLPLSIGMLNGTFTFGTTPETVIAKAFSQQGSETFEMSLIGWDANAMQAVVNEGIDSRLTAVTNSKFRWNGRHLKCEIPLADLQVILRRLYENGSEEAWSLRSGILTVLEIEEI
jgi:hypothetical protein